MRWNIGLGASIVLLVVGPALIYLILKGNHRPDLMRSMAACYQGKDSLSGIEMRFSPEGVLNVQGETLKVAVVEDKVGFSFLPDRRITYDRASPSKLVIDSYHPLLMRISADRQSLTVPGEAFDTVFQKVACSGTTKPPT